MLPQTIDIFAGTFPRLEIESNLDAVARYRLSLVQYNMSCAGMPSLPDEIAAGLAKSIGVAAAARGIRIAAVSGTFNMIHPDVAQRRRGVRNLQVLAGACAALGTRCVTLCTGTRDARDIWRAHPQNNSPGAWTDLLASMQVAVAIAEEFDVDLGIEPEVANVVDSAAKAQLVLREMRSPRLKNHSGPREPVSARRPDAAACDPGGCVQLAWSARRHGARQRRRRVGRRDPSRRSGYRSAGLRVLSLPAARSARAAGAARAIGNRTAVVLDVPSSDVGEIRSAPATACGG